MGKKKSTGKNGKVKTGAVIAGVVVVLLGAGLAYASKNDQDLKASLGKGSAIGVWWGPDGEPHVEQGRFGCCSPYCEDMFEIECSKEYGYDGTFYPGSCDYDVPECRDGCCLPECKEVPKVQCEGDYGYSGGWQPKACTDVPECEIGCCVIDDQKIQEMKAPCEDISGSWTQGACQLGYTVDMESDATIRMGGAEIDQHIDYHLYTCENSVYGDWQGEMITTTNGKMSEMSMPVRFGEDGRVEIVEELKGGISFEGRVNESKMNLSIHVAGMANHDATGKVESGAVECQN